MTGLSLCGFHNKKPVLLVVGGSLGAVAVNNAIRNSLQELLKHFQICHLCGKGKMDTSLANVEGYKQFEYIKEEMKDIFAMADIVVSRAGANAICELVALQKPNVLIPLSAKASRGDQILNANSFKQQGFSEVLDEDELTDQLLVDTILSVYNNREKYIEAIKNAGTTDAVFAILQLIDKTARQNA